MSSWPLPRSLQTATVALPPTRPRLTTKQLPPSTDRPDVPAAQRLLAWVPPNRPPLPPFHDPVKVSEVMIASWAKSTLEGYAAAVLHWYAWATAVALPARLTFPIKSTELISFIASSSGIYHGNTISKWVSGLRAYHIIHGSSMDSKNEAVLQALRGALRQTPASAIKPPRIPYTAAILIALRPAFRLAEPFDAAVWALLLAAFWGLARLGELTIPSQAAYSTRFHAPRERILGHKIRGLVHATISLPWTKTDAQGGQLVLSVQREPICPVLALRTHIRLNPGPPTAHIFSHGPKLLPMTRAAFTARVHQAAAQTQQPILSGHSLRIGGCTELLLRHVPLDAVRLAGRWSSDAWQKYIRRHVELIAPTLALSRPNADSALAMVGSLGP
ncbi:hypothetical protein CF336_g8979 [Tilletia laevis]|nr:hypothetical protein CF336_g8979 [Tilletia laevis]